MFSLSIIAKTTTHILPVAPGTIEQMDQSVNANVSLPMPQSTSGNGGQLSVKQRRRAVKAAKANKELENVAEATRKLAVRYLESISPCLLPLHMPYSSSRSLDVHMSEYMMPLLTELRILTTNSFVDQ